MLVLEGGGLINGLEVEGADRLGLVVFEDGEVGLLEVADQRARLVAHDNVGEDEVGTDAKGEGGLGGVGLGLIRTLAKAAGQSAG